MVRTKAEAKSTKNATGSSRVPKKDGGSKKSAELKKLKVTKAKLKLNSSKKGRLVPKKSSKATTDDDNSSKPRIKRKKRQQKALREIRKEQDCRDRPSTLKASKAIPYATFKRCVKEMVRETSGTGRSAVTSISPGAILILKADAEEHMRRVFSLAAGITTSGKKVELSREAIRFSNNILINPHMLCERGGTERMMKKPAEGRKISTASEKMTEEAPKKNGNKKSPKGKLKEVRKEIPDETREETPGEKEVVETPEKKDGEEAPEGEEENEQAEDEVFEDAE